MNKINVLYQNLNFKSGGYSINENLEQQAFASDETLTDLLKKASISNYEKKFDCEKSTTFEKSFKNHPRYINDESLVDLNETEAEIFTNKNKLEGIFRKITFKHHSQLVHSDDSFTNILPPCKIINTNLNTPECMKLAELQNAIEESQAEKMCSKKEKKNCEIKDEVLGVKLKSYLIKICAWLQEIRSTIQTGIEPLEGEEDYFRRQRKASEFSSRFSRNYVYQLSRLLTELRRSVQRSAVGRPGTATPARSLTNACQTVLQAVQAYCNYIPTTVALPESQRCEFGPGGSVHAKFCDLLKDTGDLCKMIRKLGCKYVDVQSSISLVEDIETNSKSLLTLIKNTLMKVNDDELKPVMKPSERKKVNPKKERKNHDMPFHKKNPLESRLSMYSVAFKKNQKVVPVWKKNAEKLAKQRFNVQSRQKIIARCPPPRDDKCRSPSPEKRNILIASQHLQSNSQSSFEPVLKNEDEIQTMVQMDNRKTSDGIRSRVEPLLKTLLAEVSAGKENDLLSQGVCEDMRLKLQNILDQVQRPVPNSSSERIEKKDPGPRNRVTVTGPKNAKLICIKDRSLFESKTETETTNTKTVETSQHPKSLSLLPALERNLSRKLPAVKSNFNLSKQYTINIVQYKIEFHKYTKPLMMYRKTSQVLPWVLTSKLTDSLFEHLLISVVNEINIDGLAQQMYKAEFETYR